MSEIDKLKEENKALLLEIKGLKRKNNAQYGLIERSKKSELMRNNLADTLREENAKKEKYLKLLLQSSSDIIIIVDESGRFAYCTDAFLSITAIPNYGFINGRKITEILTVFLTDKQLSEVQQHFQTALQSGETESFKLDIDFRGTNDFRSYSIHIGPMYDDKGEPEGAVATFHDFTDIMRAKEKAEQANTAKSAFLASMSHEIRTPMNAITGLTEMILREKNISPKIIYDHVLGIKQASDNLLAIINDILDFSKIESGKMEIVTAEYSLNSLISDVTGIIRTRLSESQILFVLNADPNIPNTLIGDEMRVRQIMVNILGNAVKYTRQGNIIFSVSAQVGEGDNLILRIEVTDTGIGIKSANLEHLFDEFSQFDIYKNRGIQGTGLGLAITKRICNMMNGDISVRSQYGKGSTFTIEIPQKYKRGEVYASVKDASEKRVIIYETRDVIAAALGHTISRLGLGCDTVGNISAFNSSVEKQGYDFVFASELVMEGVLKSLKKRHKKIKPVLIAEYGSLNFQELSRVYQPLDALVVSRVLNNIDTSRDGRGSAGASVRFIAPTARVLVVDDIATNLLVAEGLMSPFCMNIETCLSGEAAIRKVKENEPYDIIFMDHMMPEMDGLEATQRIRSLGGEEYYQKLPVVALTANMITGVKEMFLQHGMNDYLPKPIDMDILAALLEKWIPAEKKMKPGEKPVKLTESFQHIVGLNTKDGLRMCGESAQDYRDVLYAFYEDAAAKLTEIPRALQKGDIGLYTVFVHAMKSVLMNIGAPGLSSQARLLEEAGKNCDIDYLREHTDDFINRLEFLLENIKPAIADKDDVTMHDDDMLAEKLTELKTALEGMDAGKANSLINLLLHGRWRLATKENIHKLEQNILMCDYDEAVILIDKMLEET